MSKLLCVLGIILPFFISAQTLQWRGDNRDGFFNETGLMNQWPEDGPELILTIDDIGRGWSSPVIYNEKLYITGMVDTLDFLFCVNTDGAIEWQTAYGRAWNQTFPDTRATPTIENNIAYLSSGMGEVVAIDLKQGEMKWRNNAFETYEGNVGTWGVSESILLLDEKVFFTTAGSKTTMVALDKNTGEEIWASEPLDDVLAYVSPILIEHNGHKQIINVTASFIFGINPGNGNIEWNFHYHSLDDSEWDNNGGYINCTSPIFTDGFLYVTSGYNHIGAKFKMNDDVSGVELLWKDKNLDNHHGGVVLIDGVIYGSNWENNNRGSWCAISFETGELLFEERFRNKGSIVAADGMLYIYTEQPGYVALVRPNNEKLDVVSSFRVTGGSGPHWAHPVIHGGKLYVRHGEKLFVYNIKA